MNQLILIKENVFDLEELGNGSYFSDFTLVEARKQLEGCLQVNRD